MQANLTAPLLCSPASHNTGPGLQIGGSTMMEAISSAILDSSELLKGQKTVTIAHNGFVYRLQATKLGKLILTK